MGATFVVGCAELLNQCNFFTLASQLPGRGASHRASTDYQVINVLQGNLPLVSGD
jgi:hypothetical protein